MKKHNEDQTFKINLFGPNKNRVKVSNVLAIFKAIVVIMFDGNMMEVDDFGLSMDCFDFRSRHVITLISTLDPSNFPLINLSFLFLVQSLSLNIKFA